MYEMLRTEFAERLLRCEKLEMEDVLACLDLVAAHYDINQKETALAVYTGDELPDSVKMWLVVKKMEGLSAGTLDNYKRTMEGLFRTIRKEPSKITTNDLRIYLFNYQAQKKVSMRTLDKYREYICHFFTWATNEKYIETNPTTALAEIKHEERPRQALTQIELEYLRHACVGPRDTAILETLYSTGCRVSELVGLKRTDIDWNLKTVHLFGKGQKHRTSFLNAKAEVALKRYLESRTDENEFLFVSVNEPHDKITKAAVEQVIKKISERSGLEGKKITPHVLRHTTATIALQNGMPVEDIQKLLGHESVNTTMIYAETNVETVRAEHKRFVV